MVDLNPTEGAEIQKIRPAVVVSSDAIRALPLRLVVPITGWKPRFQGMFWKVKLRPTDGNGLTKDSAADTLQARGVDILRFGRRMGQLSATDMEEIVAAMAAAIEYV